MRYRFPYAGIAALEIPELHPVSVFRPRASEGVARGETEVVEEALARPIGAARLSERTNARSRVLLIVDDISRPTPLAKIVPAVLAELARGGVAAETVRILIALGTHRAMTAEEIARKLGPDVAGRCQVFNHEWANPAALHHYGRLEDGTEVVLNRAMSESDFVIGIGGIAPHPAAGFSGGGKIVAPGVATEEAVGNFHWASVQIPQREVLGVRDNPMRVMIDRMAELAGLSAIVNVVQDGHGRIIHAVCGHPVEAHKAGCAVALDVYGVPVHAPDKADIFIADTHPLDQDMWQGVKALCALDAIVPDGAAVILVTPCPEGVSPQHPEILRHGYTSLEEARRLVETAGLSKITAHNMVQGGRLLKRTRAFLVSPGVKDDEARKLGFTPCRTPQAALDGARRLKGRSARVIVLGLGGEICPIAH
jgi:nickel-dependent lactate racemase